MWRYQHGISKLMQVCVVVTVCLTIFAIIRLLSQPKLPDMEFMIETNMPANLHFIIETTVTDPPDEGTLYKIKTKEYSDSDAKVLAKAFGLDECISYNSVNNEWFAYENGELLIINGDSSSWIYRNLNACQKKYNINAVIPADEDAANLAKEYITKLDIDTSSLSITAVGTTIESEKILQKSVRFYQDVEGSELLGAPQLIVDIGDNGELKGITNYYYEFEKYATFEFKTIEQVITELQSQQAQYNGPEPIVSEATIYEVSLCYCQSVDVKEHQVYLVPVYLFSGEVETQTGPAHFSAWVPAVKGLMISN